MKKYALAITIAIICCFTACKKSTVLDEKTSAPFATKEAKQEILNPCSMLEDVAKTAAARSRRTTHSDVPVVLLLDFNGQTVTNTAWNSSYNNNEPFNFLAVPASLLSAAMKDLITQRVIEDFSGFSVTITRKEQDYQNAPADRRMRCIITREMVSLFPYGGVAYVSSLVWADNTPCLVFADVLLYNEKYIAEAVSHELGHTIGLYHQSAYSSSCQFEWEYNPGVGDGSLSWAPIMGNSYQKKLTTWHTGPTQYGCNDIQNNMEILGNVAGIKTDDYGAGLNDNTTELPSNGIKKGILEKSGDKDAFFKKEKQARRISVTSNGNSDLALEIYNPKGQLLSVYDDPTGPNVDVVISGKKYVKVRISSTQPFVPIGDGFGGYSINVSTP